jgi:hypothetical protein
MRSRGVWEREIFTRIAAVVNINDHSIDLALLAKGISTSGSLFILEAGWHPLRLCEPAAMLLGFEAFDLRGEEGLRRHFARQSVDGSLKSPSTAGHVDSTVQPAFST